MDSGKSLGKISCGLDYLAVDLLPLRRVAEVGVVEEDRSRSVRALHILLQIRVAYIPKGGTLEKSCHLGMSPEMDLMTHGKGHVTGESSGHVTEIWSRSWGGGISTTI